MTSEKIRRAEAALHYAQGYITQIQVEHVGDEWVSFRGKRQGEDDFYRVEVKLAGSGAYVRCGVKTPIFEWGPHEVLIKQ